MNNWGAREMIFVSAIGNENSVSPFIIASNNPRKRRMLVV
jgi:hypothetical protein